MGANEIGVVDLTGQRTADVDGKLRGVVLVSEYGSLDERRGLDGEM